MTTLIDSKRLGEIRGTGITVRAPAFTTTDAGHALIITSPRPILIATPAVHNIDAAAESVDWTLYASDREITDPDSDYWMEVDSGTQTANAFIEPANNLGHRAVMLVITPSVDGTQSEGVEASLQVAV